ncbi:MAG: hypothetical protein V8S37_03845 [Lachnospiraceae bacterium]
MGDMTVDELKDKKLWFLWSPNPARMGKLPKFHSQQTEEQPEQMTRIKDHGIF